MNTDKTTIDLNKRTKGEFTSNHLPVQKMFGVYASGKFIAKVYDVQSEHCDITAEEAEANAAFICLAVNNFDKLIAALRECRNELYRMKMAEALLWAAHADKAQEFASEQTEKYTQLLNTIQKENELK